MFSIVTGFCSRASDSEIVDRTKKAIVVDSIVALALAIIGILGCSGVLPLGVGIAFSACAVLQIVFAALIKRCASERTSSYNFSQ